MRPLCLLCLCAIVGSGCGPDGADEDSGADTSGSEATGVDTSSASASASVSASASASVSTSDSGTDVSTGMADSGGSTSDAGTADTGADDSSTTAGVDICVGLDRESCVMNVSCAAIACSVIDMNDNGAAPYCIGDMEFLGCHAAGTACPEVRTFTCMGDDAPVYVCPNGCIPEDWATCEPPIDGEIPPCN